MKNKLNAILFLVLVTVGCSSAQPIAETPVVSTPSPVPALASTAQVATEVVLTSTNSPAKPTLTLPSSPTQPAATMIIMEATDTPEPVAIATNAVSATATAILIDHTSIGLFEKIPDRYIEAASKIRWFFRHASVGANIDMGLNCLMDKVQPRPYACDSNIPPDQVVYNSKYDRSNWVFEFHRPPPQQNPGWYNKTSEFITRIDSLAPNEDYDAVSYKLGYVDALMDSNLDDVFFIPNPNDPYPDIQDLEALESRHPDLVLIYWSLGLSRLSYPDSQSFNQQLRQYTSEHGKILMDIADIESHLPDNTPCIDLENKGIEAICDEYTDEVKAGHLNAPGTLRMAKAVWVLMARFAGWDGISQ